MSDENKPAPQILTPNGIQSEEKVHEQPVRRPPPPQNLAPAGVQSEEAVHEVKGNVPFPADADGRPTLAYRKLLLDLTLLENTLRKRSTSNLKRRANILKRVNALRKKLKMDQLTLKDFV